jgi:hypothetical protein
VEVEGVVDTRGRGEGEDGCWFVFVEMSGEGGEQWDGLLL